MIHLRLLTEADIPFGMTLKNLAGWNQLPADWKRLLSLEPAGCFLALCNGMPAGTVTTTSYGSKLAWIGMVLVLPEFRRQGIGTALLNKAVEYLRGRDVEVIGLDATPTGNQLYRRLGFREDFALQRRQGIGRTLPADGVVPLTAARLDEVIAFDAPRFGAPRPALLRRLFDDYPHLAWTYHRNGRLLGYLMMRPGLHAHQIGPWVAAGPEAAEELFKTALTAACDTRIFLDVPVPNAAAIGIVEKYGFQIQRPYVRMFLGENRYPADARQMFAIAGAETG
jgi:ribosomal protein S18 acetylase RimI-like enzyme